MLFLGDKRLKDMADKAYAARKYERALGFYLKVIEAGTKDPETIYRVGETYQRLRRPKDANLYYQMVVQQLCKNWKYEKAIELLEKMVKVEPDNLKVREELIKLLFMLIKKVKNATQQSKLKERALKELATMAEIQEKKNHDIKAIRCYKTILDIDPENNNAHHKLAEVLHSAGRENEAYQLLITKARVLLEEGQHNEMQKLLMKADQISPGNADSQVLFHLSQLQQGYGSMGVHGLEQIVRQHPDCIEALRALGEAKLAMNQFLDAKQYLTHLFNTNGEGLTHLVKLTEKFIEKSLEKPALDIILLIQNKLIQQGKATQVRDLLVQLHQLNPSHEKTNELLYTLYRDQKGLSENQKTDAVFFLEKVIYERIAQNDILRAITLIDELTHLEPTNEYWHQKKRVLIEGPEKEEPKVVTRPLPKVPPKPTTMDAENSEDSNPLNKLRKLLDTIEEETIPPSLNLRKSDIRAAAQQEVEAKPKKPKNLLAHLPSRDQFKDILEKATESKEHLHALVFIRLARGLLPKNPTDAAELIVETAVIFNTAIRETDDLAYLGTDEFAIILNTIDNHAQVEETIGRILRHFQKPVQIDGSNVNLSAHFGIALFPTDGESVSELMKNADIALSKATKLGPNACSFFSEKQLKQQGSGMENELAQALDNNEFVLHYQPIVDLKSSNYQIVGLEALLRWEHPEQGLLYPGEFLSLFEKKGMMLHLERWVLTKTLSFIQECHKNQYKVPWLSINVSSQMIADTSFHQDIKMIIDGFDIPRSFLQLGLESREDIVRKAGYSVLEKMRPLLGWGISLVVDDLEPCIHSILNLKESPVKTVKIGPEFVKKMLDDQDVASLIRASLIMAKSFSIRTVATGIENEEEAIFLRSADCPYGQGYFFSKPLPGEIVVHLLKKEN